MNEFSSTPESISHKQLNSLLTSAHKENLEGNEELEVSSNKKEDNILLTVKAKKVSVNAKGIAMDTIDLKSIFADRSAKKMSYVSHPFDLIGKTEK